jgi:coenzyme F420-0:L-glutamate ligase/coenzyme F420-1:gamma-L-glutamate ligase
MGHQPTAEELRFVSTRRVGHLATADAGGRPSVVPFCYAVIEHSGAPALVTPLDEKPKSTPVDKLKRVRNIRANPHVSIVVDDYDEDWSRLGFVQLSGTAEIVEPGSDGFACAISALREKYPQYRSMAIDQAPLIRIGELGASSWGTGQAATAEVRPGDITSLIQGRRSVRELKPDPVPRALIEQAIAAASWAPSPHGRQPWRFAVVESAERKETLVADMASTWRAQLELDGQDAAIVQIRLEKSRRRIVEAPAIVVPCLYLDDHDAYPDEHRQAAERTMAIQSLGAAVQNFMLSLYAAGLDSGWMCAPLFCPEIVRDSLGLHASLIPQALLAVGYAAKDPVRRPRLPLDRLIVDWR